MNFKIFMTSGINNLIENKVIKNENLNLALSRFISNDWGALSDEDKELQNELLKNPKSKYEDRFMGVYIINKTKIWIMMEYDYSIKSLTFTILLPEEY
jgi:hypothetical protein